MDFFTVETLSTVGFPIAMCFYLMFKFEKILSENTKAIQALRDYMRTIK